MPTMMSSADLEIISEVTDKTFQNVAILEQPYKFNLIKAAIPEPDDYELRVKVVYVGICGSDLEAYRGIRKPEFISFPARLGHEVAGIIDKVGKHVHGLKAGMKVACRYVWGAYAEYIICRPFNVQVMPNDFDMTAISLIEILPGVIHAAELADIDSGKQILIMGQGVSGLMLTQVIALYSPRALVVTDLKERNLVIAKRYGAHHVYKIPSDKTLHADFFKDDYPDGFDIVIPSLLDGNCITDAVNCCRIGGKVVMYGGIGIANEGFDFFKVHRKRIDILSTEPKRDIDMYRFFKEGISLVRDGLIQTDGYIDRIYPLADIQKAFEERDDKSRDIIHILIKVSQD